MSKKNLFPLKPHSIAAAGFTLIELLIVVAIIAILAAIAVPNFLEAQTRAKVARVKADLRTLATGMETYRIDNNKPSPVFNTGTHAYPWLNGGSSAETRMDRYHWLTSPVAYLSNPIVDPFLPPTTDPASKLLIIWGPPSWGPVSPSLPDPNSLFKEQNVARTAAADLKQFWVGFSFGPDKDADVNDPERTSVGMQTYNPTNGSLSDGDIIRSSAGQED
jgi:prepilin-type N-terminal cleavage/methylation domain-containing protein